MEKWGYRPALYGTKGWGYPQAQTAAAAGYAVVSATLEVPMGPSTAIGNLFLSLRLTLLSIYWRFWVRRQGRVAGRLSEPLGPELLRRAEQELAERVAPVRIAVEAPLTRLRGQLRAHLTTRQAVHAVAVGSYLRCVDLAGSRQAPEPITLGFVFALACAGVLETVLNYSSAAGFLPESPIIVGAGALLLTLVVLGSSLGVGLSLRRRAWMPLALTLTGQMLGLLASGIGRAISYTTAAADTGLGQTPWAAVALVAIQVAIAAWATAKAHDNCEPVRGFRKSWYRVQQTGAAVQQTEHELLEQEAHIARRIGRIDSLHRQLQSAMHARYLLARAKSGNQFAPRSAKSIVPIACLLAMLTTSCTPIKPGLHGTCVYVMLDRSASMSDYRLARDVIDGLPDALRAGDRVTLSVVGARPLEDIGYAVDAEIPGDALERAVATVGLSTRASEVRIHRAAEALRKRLRGALDSLLREPAQQGSSLVDALSVAARSECAGTEWNSRVLVVLSDAQEQSDYVSLEHDVPAPDQLARSVAEAQARVLGWRPSFTEWHVLFVGPRGRTASHWHALASFWRSYVTTLGGAMGPTSFGATPRSVLQAVSDRSPVRPSSARP